MEKELLIQGANIISMFCRLNIHVKKDLPLRSSEIGLLIYAVKTEAPVTSRMAADFFKVSKPMITTMVASLTAKGYLEKIPSETDKRSFTLMPAAKATELVESVYEEYFKVMQLLLDKMGIEKYTEMTNLLGEANSILLEGKNDE